MHCPLLIILCAYGWQQTGHNRCENRGNEQVGCNNLLSPSALGRGLSTSHTIFDLIINGALERKMYY